MGKQLNLDKAKSLVLLTAALVMTITWAVGSSGWTRGLNIITFVGLGSILIGMMLARSILPAIIAHMFSLIIGIGWSFWVTARLLPANYSWIERWENLAVRLNSWYNLAKQGGTSYDNLMFILQMGVIVWCVGYLTVWLVFRSAKIWQAIIPGGVVLIMNLYYAPDDITFWFLIYLLLSMLLVIRFNVLKQEARWRAEGVFFRPDVSYDFLRDGFIFSALVIAIAWLAPPVVDAKTLGLFDQFQGNWQEIQGEWNRMYADLNYRNQYGAVGTFGQSFTLGGPRFLTDEPVMDVKVEGIGRYWRATTYDEYNGIGWQNSSQDSAAFGPDTALSLPNFAARQPVTQTFTLYRDGSTILYAMANVISLDRSAKVTFNELSLDSASGVSEVHWPNLEGPLVEEITYIRSNAAIDQGESYQVVSAASQATVSQLQQSGDDYPAWVIERYLQSPPITERTRQLARELTEPFDNAFDKAQAIERYLRNNIKYNERINPPPPNRDKVDYILFELKEAYCDYYATSMITMLRSVGIPARMAAGFARGSFEAEREVFHVINADAHSWVEVYFPGYGWVEFEPTAAQPNIIRPINPNNEAGFAAGSVPNLGDRPDGSQDGLQRPENIPIDDEIFGVSSISFTIPWLGRQVTVSGSAVGRSFMAVGILITVALVIGGVWWYRQQLYIAKNIFNLYEGMIRLARWMGATLYAWQTPFEHAAVITQRLPAYQREVETITGDYVYQMFSPLGQHNNGVISDGSTAHADTTLTYKNSAAWRRLRAEMVKIVLKRLLPWNR